jgi:hypothetical protein
MLSKRNTTDYSPSNISRGWKAFQMHGHPYFHRTGQARCAPSKVHKDYLARLGKRMTRVQTNEGGGHLARDSSAATLRTARLTYRGSSSQYSRSRKGQLMPFVASESGNIVSRKFFVPWSLPLAGPRSLSLACCSGVSVLRVFRKAFPHLASSHAIQPSITVLDPCYEKRTSGFCGRVPRRSGVV